MSKLSKQKQETIMSNILATLYENHPKSLFTADISKILARDEEFIKRLLLELHGKGLVIDIRKNPTGIKYLRRIRWRLSNNAYSAYKSL